MKRWKWFLVAIVSILLLASSLVIFDQKETTAVEAPRLKTTKSAEKDFVKTWTVNGMAKSQNTFDVYNNPALGTVEEILVKEGDTVTAGQALLKYENRDLENKLLELKRDKEAADVKVTHYSTQISEWESELSSYDEEESGADAKVALQKQLDDAELQLALAEKENTLLLDEIMELEKKKDALLVTSNVDGVVSSVRTGSLDKPLVTIIGQGDFILKAEIDETLANQVKTGDNLTIKVPTQEKSIKGTVQNVFMSSTSKTYILSVLPEEEYPWLEGQAAQLIIPVTLSSKAVSVPGSAVVAENGNRYVYVIVKDKLYRKKVLTGLKQDKQIEIKKGLKKGVAVVTKPSKVFVSGEPAFSTGK